MCIPSLSQKYKHALRAGVCIFTAVIFVSCAKQPKLSTMTTGSITVAQNIDRNPTLIGALTGNKHTKPTPLPSAPDPSNGSIMEPDASAIVAAPVATPRHAPKAARNKKSLFAWIQSKNKNTNTEITRTVAPANVDRVTTASIMPVKSKALEAAKPVDQTKHSNENDKGAFTLKQVITQTLQTNPDVGITWAREKEAIAGIDLAKADYKPQVDVEVSTGVENTFAAGTKELAVHRTEANIQLNQKLFDFGMTKAKVARQEKLLKSAKLKRREKAEDIAFNVVQAYLEVLKQTDLAAAAARNVKAHEAMAKLVKMSEAEGNATLADIKRVQTRLDSAKSAVLDIDNGLQGASGAFKRITNMNPKKLKRPKVLSARLGRIKPDQIEAVTRNNLALRALIADRESLYSQFQQQTGKRYPEMYLSAQANYKDNVSGDTGQNMDMRGMVGFRYKLFDGGSRTATEQKISARIIEADFDYQKTYSQLIESLEENAQSIKSSDEKAKFLADSVAAARKVVALYTEQFKVSEKSPFELLDAQLDLYNTERDLITNKFDAANATYANLKLRGQLVSYLLQ